MMGVNETIAKVRYDFHQDKRRFKLIQLGDHIKSQLHSRQQGQTSMSIPNQDQSPQKFQNKQAFNPREELLPNCKQGSTFV